MCRFVFLFLACLNLNYALTRSPQETSLIQLESQLQLLSKLRGIDVDCSDMKKCFVDEDPLQKVTGDALSVEDQKQFQKDTENRARHILSMLDELNPKGMDPQEKKLADRIAEDKRLIDLSKEVRSKALEVLMRHGIEVKLPSEDTTSVDASGRHWGDAAYKTDLDYLRSRFHKWMKKEMDERLRQEARLDVKQFQNPLPRRAKTVNKLEIRGQRDCPCSCPSTTCPCMCSAKVNLAGDAQSPVEADEFPDPDRQCITGTLC